MKKPIIAFTTLLTATLAMTSVVYADEQADKQAIIEIYRSSNEGLQHKDVNQLTADYAPEYTGIGEDGKSTTLEQLRKFWQENFRVIRQINERDDIKEIQINGKTATVIGIGYSSAIVLNPKKPGVLVPRNSVSTYQDVFKRTNNGWKLIRSRTLQDNVTWGQQQGTQGLTAQQAESLYYEQRNRLRNQMTTDMQMLRNSQNCALGMGYNCGDSLIGR